ncbi:hypothetical protein K438DRAFT_1816213 [Mycena galopus ATCC 62051]|nr:hypothetical protein K438DRAFT_1816213 [Mycena galopus ATCC 62051]
MSNINSSNIDDSEASKAEEGPLEATEAVDASKDDKNELEAARDSEAKAEAKEVTSAILEPTKIEGADPVLDSPKVDQGTPTTTEVVDAPKDDTNELEAAGDSEAKANAKETTSPVLEPMKTEGASDADPSDWNSIKPPQPPLDKTRGNSSNPSSAGRPKPRPKPPPK